MIKRILLIVFWISVIALGNVAWVLLFNRIHTAKSAPIGWHECSTDCPKAIMTIHADGTREDWI